MLALIVAQDNTCDHVCGDIPIAEGPAHAPHNWSRYRFGAWLKTALQRLHKNKLAVALANKLARIAWSVLHNEKAFDTQPEAVAI